MIVFVDTNVVIYAVESEPAFGVRAQTRIASAIAVWRKSEYPAAFKHARHNPTSRNLFWACMVFGILLGSVIALLSLDVALYAR